MTGDHEYYVYEDTDPHISNPKSLGLMLWNFIPDSSFEINFQSDDQITSAGFALEWKCSDQVKNNRTGLKL